VGFSPRVTADLAAEQQSVEAATEKLAALVAERTVVLARLGAEARRPGPPSTAVLVSALFLVERLLPLLEATRERYDRIAPFERVSVGLDLNFRHPDGEIRHHLLEARRTTLSARSIAADLARVWPRFAMPTLPELEVVYLASTFAIPEARAAAVRMSEVIASVSVLLLDLRRAREARLA